MAQLAHLIFSRPYASCLDGYWIMVIIRTALAILPPFPPFYFISFLLSSLRFPLFPYATRRTFRIPTRFHAIALRITAGTTFYDADDRRTWKRHVALLDDLKIFRHLAMDIPPRDLSVLLFGEPGKGAG